MCGAFFYVELTMQNFADLDDETFFMEFIGRMLRTGPSQVTAIMGCDITVDDERLGYAFREYKQHISTFALYLDSKNPDHFKRSGALLHALNYSKCISSVNLESSSDDLEAGFTRVRHGDAEHNLPFIKFYESYHNEFMAFHIAYKACALYEATPSPYDFDYLHNICRYLQANDNLSVDSLFIIFKSLMSK